MSEYELLAELRRWGSFKVGDPLINDWGPPLTKLLNEAADEIERLQAERDHMLALAGKVSIGPSYADIAKDARHDLPLSERTDG